MPVNVRCAVLQAASLLSAARPRHDGEWQPRAGPALPGALPGGGAAEARGGGGAGGPRSAPVGRGLRARRGPRARARVADRGHQAVEAFMCGSEHG